MPTVLILFFTPLWIKEKSPIPFPYKAVRKDFMLKSAYRFERGSAPTSRTFGRHLQTVRRNVQVRTVWRWHAKCLPFWAQAQKSASSEHPSYSNAKKIGSNRFTLRKKVRYRWNSGNFCRAKKSEPFRRRCQKVRSFFHLKEKSPYRFDDPFDTLFLDLRQKVPYRFALILASWHLCFWLKAKSPIPFCHLEGAFELSNGSNFLP